MRVAFGLKAHSGWAALVVLGKEDSNYVVIDRRRLELVEETWAKQPYHAAEGCKPEIAHDLVKRGISAAGRIAFRELRASVKLEEKRGNKVVGCGVLVTDPMPGWSVDEILAVHFRMHKAEGVLFRDALADATTKCNVRLVQVPEKTLGAYSEKTLKMSLADLTKTIAAIGKPVGPPWGKDQKEAATAAMIALSS
ncbi:MAG TPA: hypothetical protein VLA93_02985 [Pyrinomonadaceae bacterium]|nr:hypothetical protein [Pyrinomonadaceae bacterium]